MSGSTVEKTTMALARAEKFAKALQEKFAASEFRIDSLSSPKAEVLTPREKKTLQISVNSKSDISLDIAAAALSANDTSKNLVLGSTTTTSSTSSGNDTRVAKKKINVDDFESLAIIGRGAFGEVRLVRKKGDPTSREVFGKRIDTFPTTCFQFLSFLLKAMKSMLKQNMILKNQVNHIRAERDILTESINPWIVTLYNSFQVCSPAYPTQYSYSNFIIRIPINCIW